MNMYDTTEKFNADCSSTRCQKRNKLLKRRN